MTTLAAGTLAACASFEPQSPTTELDYKRRAVTRADGGIRVSTAVLTADESKAVYGVPLAKQEIQPVWIEVENREEQAYYLLSPGLDPNFFPASEAAEAMAPDGSSEQRATLDRHFRRLAFRNPVAPGATTSGFVLTNLHEGVKLVQVDLVASRSARTFSILTPVPGFRADYKLSEAFRREIYPPEQIVNYADDATFRAALKTLACCATGKNGRKSGDPLNLVIVGGLDDAFPALVRRGWRPTEEKWWGSVWRMVTSALSGEGYPDAPVSALYLFGRPQDLALQKARDNIHQRNHLRLWLSPLRYRGKEVWVGQISRDIGSRLTVHTSTLTTHKIDPDLDAARAALAEDMAYSQNLAKLGLVEGVGGAPKGAPRKNLTTDPYYTDGYRLVLVFDRTPTSLAEIDLFPWEAADARNAATPRWQVHADVGDAELRRRAVTAERRDVRVSAAVLGAADVRRMLGADLKQTRVQPVWIEVRNGTSQPLWLLRSGADPNYYSPLEVAWPLHRLFGGDANARTDDHFDKLALKSPIAPGTTHAGILFTNLEHRTKLLNLDLFGRQTLIPFTLLVPVPDEAASVLFQYPDAQVTDYFDSDALRAVLERFPCCATDATGMVQGDPLNVVLVGDFADIGAAVVRRDYRRDARADDMAQRVFGRPPDAVLRKQAQAGSPSTTLRAWLAPIRFEGRSSYLVQVGRPVGGRFARRGATDLVLHGDVDEARNLLIQDLTYSGGLELLGFVTGVGEASETQPRSAFHGARYHSDGLRAVLFFATRPLSLADVQFLKWAPYLERGDAGASGQKQDASKPSSS